MNAFHPACGCSPAVPPCKTRWHRALDVCSADTTYLHAATSPIAPPKTSEDVALHAVRPSIDSWTRRDQKGAGTVFCSVQAGERWDGCATSGGRWPLLSVTYMRLLRILPLKRPSHVRTL
eukprot:6489618-Amphidinium_carterae.3